MRSGAIYGLLAPTMKKIQLFREKKGLLPEDVAKVAGCHLRTIQLLEQGHRQKVQSRVQKGISKALGLKPVDLFTSEGFAR